MKVPTEITEEPQIGTHDAITNGTVGTAELMTQLMRSHTPPY